MILDLALVGASILLLVAGAEGLVRGSAALALRAGLSPLVVGLTIVALGTSAPELVVSVNAVRDGEGDLAVGNVVGSNVFNVALILGLTAIVHPLPVHGRVARLDAPVALGAALLLTLLLWNRDLSPLEGGLLLLGLAVYTANGFRLARREGVPDEDLPVPGRSRWQDAAFLLGGFALLAAGSEILVANAVDLARAFGVQEAVIGLTIVAAGTSLPELATSLVAAFRRQADIALGNVVGSNLFNLLGILGAASLAGELRSDGVLPADFALMVLTSAMLVGMAFFRPTLGRLEGLVLFAAFACWMTWRWPG